MPWAPKARSYWALLSRLAVGAVKCAVNGSCRHQQTRKQRFFLSNGPFPLSFLGADNGGLPASPVSKRCPLVGARSEAGAPGFCPAGSPRFCGCVAHHTPLFLSLQFIFYTIKNACIAHIISPQCHLTEQWVFMQLLTPEIPSWEEMEVLNVPFCKCVNSTGSEFKKKKKRKVF